MHVDLDRTGVSYHALATIALRLGCTLNGGPSWRLVGSGMLRRTKDRHHNPTREAADREPVMDEGQPILTRRPYFVANGTLKNGATLMMGNQERQV